jgi:putative phage-type endonuclease
MDFQEERKTGIGGSDAPIILGISPWKKAKELWAEKLNLVDPDAPSIVMERGTFLEPLIVKRYKEETGNKVKRTGKTFRHRKHKFMMAHLDGIVLLSNGGGKGILEIKNPSLKNYGKIEREGIPQMYVVQVQHYLYVKGLDWADFYAYNGERHKSYLQRVERDDELIRLLIEKEEAFWACVQEKNPPKEEDPEEMAELLPPTEGAKVLLVQGSEWEQAAQQLKDAKDLEEEVKDLKDEAKQKLISMMGDSTIAEGAGIRVYYTNSQGRKTFNKTALKFDYPDIDLEKYMKLGKPFKSFRPFYLDGERG